MNIIDTTLGIIAPHKCVGCGIEGAVMCKACIYSYPVFPSICYICARATPNYAPCANHSRAAGPKRCFIAGEYDGILRDLIHAYKFDYRRAAALDIATLLDLIVPHMSDVIVSYVPATGMHIRQRGFNHMQRVSKQFAMMRKLSHVETLIRMTSTAQQGASKATRKKQLKGAFRVVPSRVKGKNILLIDDVITTGTTVEECSCQLYAAGACSVSIAAVARTPLA